MRNGQGKRFGPLRILCLPTGGELRLGLVVSRRVGNAVQRNRFKRQLRDLFRRLLLPRLTGGDIALQALSPTASYAELEEALAKALPWLGKRLDTPPEPSSLVPPAP